MSLIDQPLDPANKTLRHASIESSELKNLYDGVVVTDEHGYAVVELPDWFAALNTDLRYQLTVVDDGDRAGFTQAKIARKLHDGRFVVRSGAPRTEIHWQVTGVRHDAFATAHPLVVEEDKPDGQRGKFWNPAEHGQPQESAFSYNVAGSNTETAEFPRR